MFNYITRLYLLLLLRSGGRGGKDDKIICNVYWTANTFTHQYVPERKSCERALDPYRISFVLLFHRIAMNFFIIIMIGEEFLWTATSVMHTICIRDIFKGFGVAWWRVIDQRIKDQWRELLQCLAICGCAFDFVSVRVSFEENCRSSKFNA